MPPILNPTLRQERGGGKGYLVWKSLRKRGWGELNCRLLFLNHDRQRWYLQSGKQEVNYELCGETSKHLSHPHWILPHGVTEWIPLNCLTGYVGSPGKKRKKHHKHFSSVQDRYMFCCPVFLLLPVTSLRALSWGWLSRSLVCSGRAFQSTDVKKKKKQEK